MIPGYVAPESLSRRESRKDLWARLLLDTATLHYVILYPSIAARLKMLKMLVFDRTRLSLSILAFLQPSPHIQPPLDNVAYVV
jgi:hypothetical protein